MGLFRRTTNKKIDKRDVDPSYDYDGEEDFEIGSVPPSVTKTRSLSRWFGGDGGESSSSSSLSKRTNKKKKKENNKNNNKERSSSASTSSSDGLHDNTLHHDHENGNNNSDTNNGPKRSSSQRERGGPPPTRQGMQMFQASQLQSKITESSNESGMHGPTTTFSSTHQRSRRQQEELNNSICSLPPEAKVAAFEGPARFDWIDVEYSAVTKIQSIFRRHLILEDEGLSTSYIRNRKRQRKATPMGFHSSNVVDEATPDLGFGCCSILAFGGDHESDEGGDTAAYRDFQRKRYEEKAREKAKHEELLRQSYLKREGLRDSVQKLALAESKTRNELLQP